MRYVPRPRKAQRTGGLSMPEKVEGALAWVPSALGSPAREQMAEGVLWGGNRIGLLLKSLEQR